MAFVPGFDHDIFVSYAHRDDVAPTGAKEGWVTTFSQELGNALSQKLEGRPPDIWSDERLGMNVELGPELTQQLERTAVLLIVLSPPYVASGWCQDERKIFMSLVRNRARSGSSVFIVEKDRVADRPAELAERFGLRFWKEEKDPSVTTIFGYPQPVTGDPYWDAINRLACKLADYLQQLASGAGPTAAQAPKTTPTASLPATGSAAPAGAVLLAEATSEVFDERVQVLNYLEQAGIAVLPSGDYPSDPEGIRAALEQYLPQCSVFVQLFGPRPGRRWDAFPLGVPGLQNDLGLKSGKPVLQWRDPSTRLDAITDPAYRALLDTANVRACGLEEFKAAIVEQLRQKAAPAADLDLGKTVLINAVEQDSPTISALVEWLRTNQVNVVKWVNKKSEGGDVGKFSDLLKFVKGYLIVRGRNADLGWISRQLQQGRKYGAQHMPKTQLGVYDCEPNEDFTFLPSGIPYLDCRQQIDEQALKSWLASLGS